MRSVSSPPSRTGFPLAAPSRDRIRSHVGCFCSCPVLRGHSDFFPPSPTPRNQTPPSRDFSSAVIHVSARRESPAADRQSEASARPPGRIFQGKEGMKTFPLPVGETLGTARSSCFRGVAVQRNPAETALTARGAGEPLSKPVRLFKTTPLRTGRVRRRDDPATSGRSPITRRRTPVNQFCPEPGWDLIRDPEAVPCCNFRDGRDCS